uniref:Uncharacterized protein n=1 Tax=Myotis myotis TaxID=51298 RepID=A0A7J7Y0N2_MYOMY|nr:hypothetical protein mMyoMyo1_011339 [Myotis myotis]
MHSCMGGVPRPSRRSGLNRDWPIGACRLGGRNRGRDCRPIRACWPGVREGHSRLAADPKEGAGPWPPWERGCVCPHPFLIPHPSPGPEGPRGVGREGDGCWTGGRRVRCWTLTPLASHGRLAVGAH